MSARVIGYSERHLLPNPEAISIFNHIPKCGGSTLRLMLAACFSKNCFLHHYNIFDLHEDLDVADAFSSHDVSGIENLLSEGKKCYYFTLLRHPLSLAISSIAFTKWYFHNDVFVNCSTEKLFYSYGMKNVLTRFLGNGDKGLAAENLFEKYAFFGLVEKYDLSVAALSEIIPALQHQKMVACNVTEKNKDNEYKLNDTMVDYFYETNRDDIELYEAAVKEFDKRYAGAYEKFEQQETIILQTVNINKNGFGLARFKKMYVTLQDAVSHGNPLKLQTEEMYVLYNSLNDVGDFYRCLMRDIDKKGSHVYFAYICAKKLLLKEPIRELGERLFHLCQQIDSGNHMRALVECCLDIVFSLTQHGLWNASDSFCAELWGWLQRLHSERAWQGMSLYAQGLVRMAEGDWSEAVLLLRGAAGLKPDDLDVRDALRRALFESGPEGLATATEEARAALEADPGTEWALRQSAVCAVHLGAQAEAVQYARLAVAKNPCYGDGWIMLAHAALAEGDAAQALEHARKAVDAVPENADNSYFFCDLLHRQGKHDEALAEVDRLLHAWPDRGRLHLIASEILEEQGRLDLALERLQLAVQADPCAVELRVRLGRMLMRLGRLEEAESLAYEALQHSSAEGWPFVYLALAAEARDNLGDALANMNKACEKQPEKRSFAAQYARLLRVAGNGVDAEAFCRQALEKDSSQSWAWRELCRCADARGDRESAQKLGAKALEIQPDDVEFRAYVASLAQAGGER